VYRSDSSTLHAHTFTHIHLHANMHAYTVRASKRECTGLRVCDAHVRYHVYMIGTCSRPVTHKHKYTHTHTHTHAHTTHTQHTHTHTHTHRENAEGIIDSRVEAPQVAAQRLNPWSAGVHEVKGSTRTSGVLAGRFRVSVACKSIAAAFLLACSAAAAEHMHDI
jgi:hypothetical protein